MFWSIFLQSLFLILTIVIGGRLLAAMLNRIAKDESDGSH